MVVALIVIKLFMSSYQTAHTLQIYVVTVEAMFYLLRVILGPASTIRLEAGN